MHVVVVAMVVAMVVVDAVHVHVVVIDPVDCLGGAEAVVGVSDCVSRYLDLNFFQGLIVLHIELNYFRMNVPCVLDLIFLGVKLPRGERRLFIALIDWLLVFNVCVCFQKACFSVAGFERLQV